MTSTIIIDIANHQYQVSQGSIIDVPLQKQFEEGKVVTLPNVLAVIDPENNITAGRPHLGNITVKAKVIKHHKGPKTTEIHYKAKSRYRRRVGFRQQFTRLEITQIQTKTK
ncbi:MAG: 50S ribosomal protein L21 [bacterium]|nr:50S ribosomal protein L21 [bacterium]